MRTHLQTSHLNLILPFLLPAQILKRSQVALDRKLAVTDVGDETFLDDLLDSVEGVDEPHAAVIAFDCLFCLPLAQGLVEAAVVVGAVAYRTEEVLVETLETPAGTETEELVLELETLSSRGLLCLLG